LRENEKAEILFHIVTSERACFFNVASKQQHHHHQQQQQQLHNNQQAAHDYLKAFTFRNCADERHEQSRANERQKLKTK
jgi:hypothetical protein